jgi:hypothetical protein
MYCDVCGGPFSSYKSWNLPGLQEHGIDTDWLSEAIIEYYTKGKEGKEGKKVQEVTVRDYDAYGNFTDDAGLEHDVGEAQYNKEVRVIHTACLGKPVPRLPCFTPLSAYQEQFFDIDRLIADGKQHMLRKPSTN